MLFVCRGHVKQGVSRLHAPHIKEVPYNSIDSICAFCDETAHYKLFYSVPTFNKEYKRIKVLKRDMSM